MRLVATRGVGRAERETKDRAVASVRSRFRTWVKPLLFKMLGESAYRYVQVAAKIKDIEQRLVEEAEMALFPHLVGADDEVIDVGANYAYHTHRLAQLCSHGTVYAFEPIPFTFGVCQKIVEYYRLENVQLYSKGLGQATMQATFRVPVADFGGISGGQSHLAARNNELEGRERHYQFNNSREITCELVALDEFLPELQKLTFVKMDIEGGEWFALQGMRSTLERHQPVLMLEINPFFLEGFGVSQDALRAYLRDLGYQLFRYQSASGRMRAYPDEPFDEANYLALTTVHQEKYAHLMENRS